MSKKWKYFTPDGHPVAVFKKGRKHTVFVDVTNGKVLIQNPLPLLLAPLLAAAMPTLIEKGSEFISSKFGGKKAKSNEVASMTPSTPSTSFPKSNFDKALMLESLESRKRFR